MGKAEPRAEPRRREGIHLGETQVQESLGGGAKQSTQNEPIKMPNI